VSAVLCTGLAGVATMLQQGVRECGATCETFCWDQNCWRKGVGSRSEDAIFKMTSERQSSFARAHAIAGAVPYRQTRLSRHYWAQQAGLWGQRNSTARDVIGGQRSLGGRSVPTPAAAGAGDSARACGGQPAGDCSSDGGVEATLMRCAGWHELLVVGIAVLGLSACCCWV
jgi:hypothetical protein